MTNWNFADIWEVVAEKLPDAQCLRQGERIQSWSETNQRANALAEFFTGYAKERQEKIAHYLYNCNEYLESLFAIFKAGLVPVNTNYRYGEDEIVYLWDNADVIAVIFHGVFTERIEKLKDRVPNIRTWLWVDDGSGNCPSWATKYEDVASKKLESFSPKWGRSPDDLYILYTGGTTGMPKGVMWRQDDLFCVLNASNFVRWPENGSLDDIRKGLIGPGAVHLAACPLMHGTGAMTSFAAWSAGGSVVTLTKRTFDPIELLDTVEKAKVNSIAIVGDAFAKPILKALDENPGRWNLSSLFAIISSGVMWSEQVKKGLLKHHPNMLLVDSLGSSEAIGMGTSVSSAAKAEETAKFTLGENAIVIDENLQPIKPGSGQVGRVAVRGRTPIGYYKDEEKTRNTFPVINGVRYSIPGDYATVFEDGTIHVLGRGSVCINTGGEKVYPEEVEEVLKLHECVQDAAAVGVPDERFGEVVAAVIEPSKNCDLNTQEIIDFVKSKLAGYKAPKYIVTASSLNRSPSGKLDYAGLKQYAIDQLRLNA